MEWAKIRGRIHGIKLAWNSSVARKWRTKIIAEEKKEGGDSSLGMKAGRVWIILLEEKLIMLALTCLHCRRCEWGWIQKNSSFSHSARDAWVAAASLKSLLLVFT